MTTANDIIKRAYRMTGVLASGESLNADDQVIGLEVLNALINDMLPDLPGVSVDGDYTSLGNEHCLVDGTSGALTVTLPADPSDGMRVQVTDVAADFSSHNVTLARNGRLLEAAAADQTLSTNGVSKVWMYRGDTGNWHVLSPLAATDTLPFPARYDQGLAAMLAVLLHAEAPNGELSPALVAVAEEGRRQLEARYSATADLYVDLGLQRQPWMAARDTVEDISA